MLRVSEAILRAEFCRSRGLVPELLGEAVAVFRAPGSLQCVRSDGEFVEMGSIEFVDLGPGEVVHTTDKAALVALEDTDQRVWIPFSVMATPTAAQMEKGAHLDRVRVEDWFAGKLEG